MVQLGNAAVAVALLLGLPGIASAQKRIELGALNGVEGAFIAGPASADATGYSVGNAGDINGDGIADLLLGAPLGDPAAAENGGLSFVVFGRGRWSTPTFELDSLDGANGFRLVGIEANDESGTRVRNAGDLNGDGLSDLAIGAPRADHDAGTDAGEVYVIFGNAQGFAPTIDLGQLDGTNGFTIRGAAADDFFGSALSGAGDFNGDGIDDLIVGAHRAQLSTGEARIIFGSATGFAPVLYAASLDGTNGLVLRGKNPGDFAGRGVSSAGDLNNDGIADVVVGASLASAPGSFSGEAYVVFGSLVPFPASLDLAALDGSNGFTLNGAAASEELGESVSHLGDVNNDGISDLVLGAPGAELATGPLTGRAYVLFGSAAGYPATFDLSALDGTNGFIIDGLVAAARTGDPVSDLGDFNGDGIADFIVGAGIASVDGRSQVGQSYLLFGSAAGFPARIALSELPANRGYLLNGFSPGEMAGLSVGNAGDFNNDGLSDVVIGAAGSANGSGGAYLLFGNRDSARTVAPPAQTAAGAFFGSSVAVSGNRIAIGIPGNAGRVSVYRIEGAAAVLDATLDVPPGFTAVGFGADVALQGDTLVVGSQSARQTIAAKGTAPQPLHVAVYRRDNTGQWVFSQALSSDGASSVPDRFGLELALDGNTLVIGAPDDDTGETAGSGSGAAWVFARPDRAGEFALVRKLKPETEDGGSQFGAAVAVRGNRIAVGAPTARPQGADATGAVTVYQLSGDSVTALTTVTGSASGHGAAFGADLALDSDGSLLAGAAFEAGETSGQAGAAYLFSAAGSELSRIKPFDPVDNDAFGLAVALKGEDIIIGAPGAPQRGAVYRFRRTGASVVQVSRTEGFSNLQSLGAAVAAEGRTVVSGAPLSGADAGGAFLQIDDGRIFFGGFED